MNWGTKIVIVFSLFVAGILIMVFKASMQQMDLVVPDYYEQELKYQGRIDEIQRATQLSEKVICRQVGENIEIVLPKEMQQKNVKALLWLYCIADKSKDIKKDLATSTGRFLLPLTGSNSGMHDFKIQWESEAVSYYHEQKLFIQ
ncbi:MAG TPA: FixH family protein [Ferruginibacter sp.]|nr:FixH family protein [Ferruginibacter sp.]